MGKKAQHVRLYVATTTQGLHMFLLNKNGWQMSSAELRQRIGLKAGGHLPVDGLGPVDVDGTIVHVHRKHPGTKTRQHRVMALCTCGKYVPAGRLHQHRNSNAHTQREIQNALRGTWSNIEEYNEVVGPV
jgi:hypothetical protein